MKDELFDRDYQSARSDLNDGIDRGLAGLLAAFKTLHRIQWSAPWKTRSPRARRTGLA